MTRTSNIVMGTTSVLRMPLDSPKKMPVMPEDVDS